MQEERDLREKPYNDLNSYLVRRFGGKVYKLALSGGMSCPNRDGTLGRGGCIFCSEGGSGDFAAPAELGITAQIAWAREKLRNKLGSKYSEVKYIAYFQSFTNTYAPVEYLRQIFTEAINNPCICALSIGTRPDCLEEEVIALLKELNRIKPVWIELGLQTIHESTARYIGRGYELPVFDAAVAELKKAGIEVIVHVILGLPGEDREKMLDTVKYVSRLTQPEGEGGVRGIKLQLLHIMEGTALGHTFTVEPEELLERLYIKTPEQYLDILEEALDIVSPDLVIHRLTGDAPRRKLLFPKWSSDKKMLLNSLNNRLRNRLKET